MLQRNDRVYYRGPVTDLDAAIARSTMLQPLLIPLRDRLIAGDPEAADLAARYCAGPKRRRSSVLLKLTIDCLKGDDPSVRTGLAGIEGLRAYGHPRKRLVPHLAALLSRDNDLAPKAAHALFSMAQERTDLSCAEDALEACLTGIRTLQPESSWALSLHYQHIGREPVLHGTFRMPYPHSSHRRMYARSDEQAAQDHVGQQTCRECGTDALMCIWSRAKQVPFESVLTSEYHCRKCGLYTSYWTTGP